MITEAIAVKERPILFSGEMVRAILEGRKSQTRRVAKFIPTKKEEGLNTLATSLVAGDYCTGSPTSGKVLYSMRGGCWNQVTDRLFCPYGEPGDQLWVRETCHPYIEKVYTSGGTTERQKCIYRADGGTLLNGATWKPSIFMPRWASRITLVITQVRVERVRDISDKDAEAEGMQPTEFKGKLNGAPSTGMIFDPRMVFRYRWDMLNGKRGFGWAKNPWVWVIEFKRLSVTA